ncbi:MAG: PilZ domain-containing protein [Armatimonadetes bacterium]|nr:PilZ domain-containing protein [Armatimonadota bacterium]
MSRKATLLVSRATEEDEIVAASRKSAQKPAPRGKKAPAVRGADKQEALFGDVLRAESETGATPQNSNFANRRAAVRVNSLLGAILEPMALGAGDLSHLLLDVEGNLTLDLLPEKSGDRIVIVDLSAGGLKGATSGTVPEAGKTVALRIFATHDDDPVRVLAEVAWKRPLPMQGMTAFGLRFVGIHRKDSDRIEAIVRSATEGA